MRRPAPVIRRSHPKPLPLHAELPERLSLRPETRERSRFRPCSSAVSSRTTPSSAPRKKHPVSIQTVSPPVPAWYPAASTTTGRLASSMLRTAAQTANATASWSGCPPSYGCVSTASGRNAATSRPTARASSAIRNAASPSGTTSPPSSRSSPAHSSGSRAKPSAHRNSSRRARRYSSSDLNSCARISSPSRGAPSVTHKNRTLPVSRSIRPPTASTSSSGCAITTSNRGAGPSPANPSSTVTSVLTPPFSHPTPPACPSIRRRARPRDRRVRRQRPGPRP